jgi:hypothetical protein
MTVFKDYSGQLGLYSPVTVTITKPERGLAYRVTIQTKEKETFLYEFELANAERLAQCFVDVVLADRKHRNRV